jgi:hypothetical protein
MITGSAHDLAAVDFASSNPLTEAGILQHVLGYVGPGHWYFLATVSSLWRDLYARVADRTMQKKDCMGIAQQFTCVPQMTLLSEQLSLCISVTCEDCT